MGKKDRWNAAGPVKPGPQKQAAPSPPPAKQEPVRRDAQERPIPPPLKNPDVNVDARPRPAESQDESNANVTHSNKIDKSMKRDIGRAIEEAKDGGYPKQFEAARKAAEKVVKENVDPATVHEVKVSVSGTVDGQKKTDKYVIPVPERKDPNATPAAKPAEKK